jgi:tyrosyl-DNA phosphodiesterase-1
MERPSKRAKVSSDSQTAEDSSATTPLASLHRQVSPPPARSQQPTPSSKSACPIAINENTNEPTSPGAIKSLPKRINSPIQLTQIRDLPTANNVDTVKLRDILGDPMIRECWQFNYLFDVDFLMSNFDEDVRSFVQVKVVHGSWQKEAPNRIRVEVSLWTDLVVLLLKILIFD